MTLLSNLPDELHTDFSKRISFNTQEQAWQDTAIHGISCIPIEFIAQTSRQTMIMHFQPNSVFSEKELHRQVEIYVLDGALLTNHLERTAGTYIRCPNGCFTLSSPEGATLLIKLSQMHETDDSQRIIHTFTEDSWLPGPTDGIEIFPLHGWQKISIMLMRWTATVSMKPSLNPEGEEIYVIKGCLKDNRGQYPQGSWIRNPVQNWQSWQADKGTLIYYKNGHFPDTLPPHE